MAKYKLKIKSLKKGYQEIDDIMLHAIFQCIVNYVDHEIDQIHWFKTNDQIEDELKNGYMKEEEIIQTRNEYYQIMSLYRWWEYYLKDPDKIFGKDPLADAKHPRPVNGKLTHENDADRITYIQKTKDHWEWDEKRKKQITEKMIEAIKLRYILWS